MHLNHHFPMQPIHIMKHQNYINEINSCIVTVK